MTGADPRLLCPWAPFGVRCKRTTVSALTLKVGRASRGPRNVCGAFAGRAVRVERIDGVPAFLQPYGPADVC